MSGKKYLIFDYGASHGRCLVAKFNGSFFIMELIHEFENRPVNYAGTLYWDILRLSSELDIGLQKAFKKYNDIASIGIDTWGCDFGFLDKQGRLIANPVNYRDNWRHKHKRALDETIGEYNIFNLGGANTNPIMGLYHMYALKCENASELRYAHKFMMIPDLLNYYLTGETANEYTNATMSLMVDQVNTNWQYELIDKIGVSRDLFLEMHQPGTVLGRLRLNLCRELNIPSIPVICVATHDTASAISGIPLISSKKNWAFISLGTWAIFGREINIINNGKEAFKSGFANQGGVEGKNNFVNLLTGLWIVQQCRERWNAEKSEHIPWDEIVRAAECSPAGKAFIDIQDPQFSLPDPDMPGIIRTYCRKSGQHVPENMGEIARVIFESMVLKFKSCVEIITELMGEPVEILHLIGGGVQNKSLCQWIADATGLEVVAGPIETTSVGNLLMQMKALNDIDSIEQGRSISSKSSQVISYKPIQSASWPSYFEKYKELFTKEAK